MNILQVISSNVAGGRELFCVPVSLKLKEKGHKVSIMCRKGSPVEAEALRRGIDVIHTGFNWYFNPVEILRAARAIKAGGFEIIHSHWTRDVSNLIVAAAFAGGVPIVCTKHVYSTQMKKDLFHAWAAARLKVMMCVCELVRKNLLDTVPIAPAKVVTIYNGIDTKEEWRPGKFGGSFRKESGIGENAFLVCMAGRVNSGKGQHVLVAAAKKVLAVHPEAVFVFAGRPEGPEEEKYYEGLVFDVKEAGLEKQIRFLGFRSDLPSIMDASDAVVMCSVFETFGLVLIQGMAMEKPVIGTNAGGVPEIITDGSNGLLFEYGDHEKLAELLIGLIENPGKRKLLGTAARRTVEEKFELADTVKAIEKIYLACVKSRS